MPVVPERQNALEEPELRFLYDEGRSRLNEMLAFADQQEAKALAIARLSLIIIAASGIFGDLALTAGYLVLSFSLLAVAATLGVAAIAILIVFYPAEWETGLNVESFTTWARAGATVERMREYALSVFVAGYKKNYRVLQRGRWLKVAIVLLVLQVGFVVAVEIAALATRPS